MTQPKTKTSSKPERKNSTKNPPLTKNATAMEGEGSYTATRDYNRKLKQDLASRDIGKGARKALRALEGAEGEELRQAEKKGKQSPLTAPR